MAKRNDDPFGFFAAIQVDHLTDEQVEIVNNIFDKGGITCPTSPLTQDGKLHTIAGCGSANVAQDAAEPNLWDCLDCGIWFDPSKEA